jgi:hypothetical protein
MPELQKQYADSSNLNARRNLPVWRGRRVRTAPGVRPEGTPRSRQRAPHIGAGTPVVSVMGSP